MSITKSPRARAIESTPINPLRLVVPGDSSPSGRRYANTFGNDFRQLIDWGPGHETQVMHLLASAQPVRMQILSDEPVIKYRTVNVPLAEAVRVFLQSVPAISADETTNRDDVGYFDIVTDDGRQRRRDAIEINRRIRWIVDHFAAPIWRDEADPAQRLDKLREALLRYDGNGMPPQASTTVDLTAAPWLTEAFIDEMLTSPATWIDGDGKPVAMALRVDVVGENVDLNDENVLIANIRSKEASIETPLHIKAAQYMALLGIRSGIRGGAGRRPRFHPARDGFPEHAERAGQENRAQQPATGEAAPGVQPRHALPKARFHACPVAGRPLPRRLRKVTASRAASASHCGVRQRSCRGGSG